MSKSFIILITYVYLLKRKLKRTWSFWPLPISQSGVVAWFGFPLRPPVKTLRVLRLEIPNPELTAEALSPCAEVAEKSKLGHHSAPLTLSLTFLGLFDLNCEHLGRSKYV